MDPSLSTDDALTELENAGWDADRIDNLKDDTGEIDSHKAKEAVLKSRFVARLVESKLTPEQAEIKAETAWGAMFKHADRELGLDPRSFFAVFGDKNTEVCTERDDGTSSGTGENLAKQQTDADARKALAGIGEEGFLANISKAISQVGKSGEKADFKTVLADVMGVDTEGVLAIAADKRWDKATRERIEKLIIDDPD